MTPEDLIHHSELTDDVYPPNLKSYNKQNEGQKQGSKEGTRLEQSESPKEIQDSRHVVDQPRSSQQPLTNSTDIDLPSLQEYISRLPQAIVPEFALLLAQRMKQHIRDSDLRDQDITTSQAESLHRRLTQTGEPIGRPVRSESTPALRYIVTPHPNNPDRSIKQRVGEPENIPYLPPGVYRETIEGTMELESSFRRSVVDQRQEQSVDVPNIPAPVAQGWFRKVMRKVFKRGIQK